MAPRESSIVHLDPAEHSAPGDVELALAALLDPERALDARLSAMRQVVALERERAVFPLAVAYAEQADADGPLARALAHALAVLGATDRFVEALTDADPAVRLRAARFLGMLRDPSAVLALIAALSDKNARVREHAAAALHHLRDRRAFPYLALRMFEDPEPDVRAASAQALGELTGADVERTLARAITSERDAFVAVLIERAHTRVTRRTALDAQARRRTPDSAVASSRAEMGFVR
ncbi:HEAT repeat domain-containing protein [Myxococcota bacterium]|nr:HEAT repeat domain-containing protein [Myxococcota bacterium]